MNPKLTANFLSLCIQLGAIVANASCAAQAQPPDMRHFKFRRETSGKTMKKGGIEVSFTEFKADDGTTVERLVEDYKSAEAAKGGLEEECKQSSSISEDGYRTDAQGKRVGRRVVLVFRAPANALERNVIAWTDGPLLYLIRSSSRVHLLDFEHQVYPVEKQGRRRNPRDVPLKDEGDGRDGS